MNTNMKKLRKINKIKFVFNLKIELLMNLWLTIIIIKKSNFT
jgi:hypothetical protein